MKIGTELPVPVIHRDTPTAASESAQFGFKACEGFLRDSEPFTGEGKPKEASLLGPHHFAFAPVDLYLEDFLKEPADTLHHPLSSTLGLHEDDKVIGISGELMPPSLQLLVEIIQGRTLSELMIDYGLGTSTTAKYEIKRIDSDYFAEE